MSALFTPPRTLTQITADFTRMNADFFFEILTAKKICGHLRPICVNLRQKPLPCRSAQQHREHP